MANILNAMFATDVQAKMMVLHGVIEVSWRNPSHPNFKEVAVFRKTNDFVYSELDPYGTLIYQGPANHIYDYSISKGATTEMSVVMKEVIGTYDRRNNKFLGQIEDPLDGDTLYYYTVFSIDKNGKYHFSYATTATARPNKNHNISERLYEYLPSIYRIEDKDFQLQRYLKISGMVFDYIMSASKNMSHFIDIDTCEPYQLKYIANLLDWDLDETLPIPSQRQSLKSAIDVYRNAGTKKGLDMLVKTNSGFPNTSGVAEGRDFTLHSVYFGYFPFDLVRYNDESTPNFDTLDPNTIGRAGDPLKYTWDFRPQARQQSERFIAYVRKTTQLTPEAEELMRKRLTKLLTRFSPSGTKFDIEIY